MYSITCFGVAYKQVTKLRRRALVRRISFFKVCLPRQVNSSFVAIALTGISFPKRLVSVFSRTGISRRQLGADDKSSCPPPKHGVRSRAGSLFLMAPQSFSPAVCIGIQTLPEHVQREAPSCYFGRRSTSICTPSIGIAPSITSPKPISSGTG